MLQAGLGREASRASSTFPIADRTGDLLYDGVVSEVVFRREALLALAKQHKPNLDLSLEEMPGGASLRRFFRVRYADGDSAIGMFFPDGAGSEEVLAEAEKAPEWPFVEVLRLLQQRGVDVPRLLAADCAAGWLLVEDLGEQTLADCLARHPARKTELYQRAVRDLASAQLALAELPVGSVVAKRSFDVGLLRWEIEHFREWGLEARDVTLSRAQRQLFDESARGLAEAVFELPYGFVHRDYQSRNLMVHEHAAGERLAWVDFQDALLGPRAYDLVALLSDSYQSFDAEFIEARLREYVAHRGLADSDYEQVRHEFDLITVQRKLKDAGRFVFIERKKGDSSYLQFIDPSLRKIRGAMNSLQQLPAVRALDELLSELDVWPD